MYLTLQHDIMEKNKKIHTEFKSVEKNRIYIIIMCINKIYIENA